MENSSATLDCRGTFQLGSWIPQGNYWRWYKYDAQNRLIQSDILDINDQPCLNLWNGSRYKYIYADADQIASDDFPFSFRYINDSRFNKKYLAKEILYTLDENGAYIQRLHDNVNPFDNELM